MDVRFTAVYRKVPEGFISFVEELPSANTRGATLEEARTSLEEAVALVLDANRTLAEEDLKGAKVIREPFTLWPRERRLRSDGNYMSELTYLALRRLGFARQGLIIYRVELAPGQLFYIPPTPHDSWVLGTGTLRVPSLPRRRALFSGRRTCKQRRRFDISRQLSVYSL